MAIKSSPLTATIGFGLLLHPATALAHGPPVILGVIALALAILPVPIALWITPRGSRKRFSALAVLTYIAIWFALVLLPLHFYSILFATFAGYLLIPAAILWRIGHRRRQDADDAP